MAIIRKLIVRWHLRWLRDNPEWMHTVIYEGGTVVGRGAPPIPGKAGE